MTYVETDCTIEVEGRTFESGGAMIEDNAIVAYLGKDGVLTDWLGNALGTWRMVAMWKTPNSFVSSYMMQVEATVDGVVWTGRSVGVGMAYRGKRKVIRD